MLTMRSIGGVPSPRQAAGMRWWAMAFVATCCSSLWSQPPTPAELSQQLQPFVAALVGESVPGGWSAQLRVPIDDRVHEISLRVDRYDDASFDLQVLHQDYAVVLRRRAQATALALPKHQIVYVGRGATHDEDHLHPEAILPRLIRADSKLYDYLPLISAGDPGLVAATLVGLSGARWDQDEQLWRVAEKAEMTLVAGSGAPSKLHARQGQTELQLELHTPLSPPAVDAWPGMRLAELPRGELEQQLARGARRTAEILWPSRRLTDPPQTPRTVAHGRLEYVDGQRLAILQGTPEEIGHAHGELLQAEAQKCIDSVLHAFGTVQTVVTGRWFRQDLADAYARLRPYIPEDHLLETRALAASLGQDPHLMELLNVFPELFHCSGFAVFNSATVDGTLYHGRVLDYMTQIGLQDSATTFIISVDGKIPFVNVGYAAFVGSVSGMNRQSVSLGEMGGRGEGKWDGVPMATLMRRALEECTTLDEVQQLWSESPRTCEYYYVFADGKTNRAVGVAATPEKIEFIQPGESHELLGAGIPDAVVLSAGERLQCLRQRVQEKHGQLDAESAMGLMSRPVAMQSNLHNVLFVPAQGILYVANADHKKPAADCGYVKIDLSHWLDPAPDAEQVTQRGGE